MGSHRVQLPHETDRVFLTDGGTETWLMHKRGLELPHFSSFHLLNDRAATDAIRAYYRAFADIAVEHGTNYIFDSLTYRASRDWGDRLGYSAEALADMNHRCLALYRGVAAEAGMHPQDVVISGCIGPRADAYGLDDALTADAAEAYHRVQVETFKSAGADLVTALSLSSSQEAIGIVRASGSVDLPSAVAFMLEKDHRLQSGETLRQAIEAVDAATGGSAAYFLVNCAHPLDIAPALAQEGWVSRVRGIRANASDHDHSVLSQLDHLDEGDPDELAEQYAGLKSSFPHLNVFGGCCGTDFAHVRKISDALRALEERRGLESPPPPRARATAPR
jgi:S-methylmethionine-dependent homocysteine/selenocysteine methylase